MGFSPNNKIVKRCLQGMAMEDQGNSEEADSLFHQAWKEATDDFEKYLAAFFVARRQKKVSNQLTWFETTLHLASKINDASVQAAFPAIYMSIGKCYEELGDVECAKKNRKLAASFMDKPEDNGPFYHGTRAELKIGDLLTAGNESNYKSGILMNHVYFTALINGAALAAALAKGNGRERVYLVEPMEGFENDPNVTNKKFPGNPTRSYRTRAPLRIVGEVPDWLRQTPEELEKWRKKLADSDREIIN